MHPLYGICCQNGYWILVSKSSAEYVGYTLLAPETFIYLMKFEIITSMIYLVSN